VSQGKITKAPLQLLSVVIPVHDDAEAIAPTVEHLHLELRMHDVPHEMVVVDDGSADRTWEILADLQRRIPQLLAMQNPGPYGFGRAVVHGLERSSGDAIVIMMADGSDDCRDVVRYWAELNKGSDCVFGSRFVKGGGAIGYPFVKLVVNRLANLFLKIMFGLKLNDTTNVFKAYRRDVIEGCRPLISPHFNLSVELPLKAIVRGYTWVVIPVRWHNRRTGRARLELREMGSRYFFTSAGAITRGRLPLEIIRLTAPVVWLTMRPIAEASW
jgi:dolichol-phosphate mannosyltransferase